MAADGYPDDDDLAIIREWDVAKDAMGLVKFIENHWAYAMAGYFKIKTGKNKLGHSIWRVNMDTAGWSGNESIIDALQQNAMFWIACWESSRRGGHYVFEIPKDWGKK